MGRDGLRDVVLEEDPEPHGDVGPAGHAGDGRADGAGLSSFVDVHSTKSRAVGWYRRHRALLAGVTSLTVLTLTATVVDVVRERERATLMSVVPRVLRPLDPTIAEAWSVPGGWEHSLILGPGLTITEAGLTLAVFATDNGSAVVANDLDTGAELWTAPLPTLRGRPRDNIVCRVLGEGSPPDEATHVACRFVVPMARGADRPAYGPGAESRLVVLDARTGERVTERSLGVGYGAMESLGRDVVLVDILPDGRPVVTREDPVTETVHWTFQGDVPMPSTGLTAGPPARPFVTVQGDIVTVVGPITWALSADGREIDRWGPVTDPATSFIDVGILPDGRFVVGTAELIPEPARLTDVHVITPGNQHAVRMDGGVIWPVVDDGSASDLLLTDSPETGRIVAVDSATGTSRWAVDHGLTNSDFLVMDRRVVYAERGEVVAVDTDTGSVLWTALDGQLPSYQQLLTDGDLVLAPTGNHGEPMTLHALDLDDGRTRWTATGPADVVAYFPVDDGLLALQQETTVMLR